MHVPGMRQSFRSLRLLSVILALAAVGFYGAGAAGGVPRAEAYSSAGFCDTLTAVTIAAGGRCVDYRRVRHRFLRATIIYGDGPGNFCVGAKQNPDGTGANTNYFGCHIPTLDGRKVAMTPTNSSPGSPLGYATIINTTGVTDLFYGYMEWYP